MINAKILFDNKELILGSTYLTGKMIYATTGYIYEAVRDGIRSCRCGVCDNRRANGEKPIH